MNEEPNRTEGNAGGAEGSGHARTDEARGQPTLSLIAAVADDGVIGRDGDLPWRLPDDMRQFRRRTTGHVVVMGRRTWESLPKALPKRHNLVVSRTLNDELVGAEVCRSLDAALARAEGLGAAEVWVIGGASLYREALPRADRVVLTLVDAEVEGDTRWDARAELDGPGWHAELLETHPADDRHPYPFRVVEYARG